MSLPLERLRALGLRPAREVPQPPARDRAELDRVDPPAEDELELERPAAGPCEFCNGRPIASSPERAAATGERYAPCPRCGAQHA